MLSGRMPVAINRNSREHGVLSDRVPDSIHYTGFHEKRSTWSAFIVFLPQKVFGNRNRWIYICSKQDLSDVSNWR